MGHGVHLLITAVLAGGPEGRGMDAKLVSITLSSEKNSSAAQDPLASSWLGCEGDVSWSKVN